MVGEPAGLLVIQGGFDPGDLISDVFGLLRAAARRSPSSARRVFPVLLTALGKAALTSGSSTSQKKFLRNSEGGRSAPGRGGFSRQQGFFSSFPRTKIGSSRSAASSTLRASGPTKSRRWRERDDIFRVYATKSRLQSHNAAQRSRDSDRATRIRADAAVTQARLPGPRPSRRWNRRRCVRDPTDFAWGQNADFRWSTP